MLAITMTLQFYRTSNSVKALSMKNVLWKNSSIYNLVQQVWDCWSVMFHNLVYNKWIFTIILKVIKIIFIKLSSIHTFTETGKYDHGLSGFLTQVENTELCWPFVPLIKIHIENLVPVHLTAYSRIRIFISLHWDYYTFRWKT